jgi:hypothetical protein
MIAKAPGSAQARLGDDSPLRIAHCVWKPEEAENRFSPKPEIGTEAVRIVGSSLLVTKRVARLTAFRVVRGRRFL